jgi:uncharacterized protein YeaO (DUF488 family)
MPQREALGKSKGTKMIIKTGAWSAKVPDDHIKIGISRGVPRGMPAGYRIFKTLAPGDWFNSVTAPEYVRRFKQEILGEIEPEETIAKLRKLSGGKTVVMCCYEKPSEIAEGKTYCHRHIVAEWLEAAVPGLSIPEFGALPGFERWRLFTRNGAEPPKF